MLSKNIDHLEGNNLLLLFITLPNKKDINKNKIISQIKINKLKINNYY